MVTSAFRMAGLGCLLAVDSDVPVPAGGGEAPVGAERHAADSVSSRKTSGSPCRAA